MLTVKGKLCSREAIEDAMKVGGSASDSGAVSEWVRSGVHSGVLACAGAAPARTYPFLRVLDKLTLYTSMSAHLPPTPRIRIPYPDSSIPTRRGAIRQFTSMEAALRTSSSISPINIQKHLYASLLDGRTADVSLRVGGTWEAVYRLHRVILTQAVSSIYQLEVWQLTAEFARASFARCLHLDSQNHRLKMGADIQAQMLLM